VIPAVSDQLRKSSDEGFPIEVTGHEFTKAHHFKDRKIRIDIGECLADLSAMNVPPERQEIEVEYASPPPSTAHAILKTCLLDEPDQRRGNSFGPTAVFVLDEITGGRFSASRRFGSCRSRWGHSQGTVRPWLTRLVPEQRWCSLRLQ
jgi:hypothetical protein